MRPVAQISIEYATLTDFTSLGTTRIGPKDYISVSPKTFARYTLRNRDLLSTGEGLNDSTYLAYLGGFLTEQDKLNIKYSNFEIKNTTTTSGGNFSAVGFSTFQNNININQSLVTRVKTLDTVGNFIGNTNKFDALTVKDFKDFNFYPGMLMAWSGSYEKLIAEMPYWRLCALPDAEKFYNNIYVPNLFSSFVIGGQSLDQKIEGSNQYYTGDKGGEDAIALKLNEIPRHTHNVNVSSFDADAYLTGQTTFYQGGGAVSSTTSSGRACSHSGASCTCDYSKKFRKECWPFGSWFNIRILCRMVFDGCKLEASRVNYFNASNVASNDGFSVSDYRYRDFEYSTTDAKIDVETEDVIGGTDAHENRPQYYALAYIIYVGVPR